MLVDTSEGCFQICERVTDSCRNPCCRHDIFGERLRRLKLGCRGARSKDKPSFGSKTVSQPLREGRFRSDDRKVDSVHIGGVCEPIEIISGDGEILSQLLRSGISRSAVQMRICILTAERPAERMLAAATAHHEKSHDFWAFLKASRADAAARRATSAICVARSRASPA